MLKEEKRKNPNIINYNFTILKDFPGYIVLGYVPKANPHYEYIKIKPKGLYFHEQYFSSIDDITNFFKKGYSTQAYRDYVSKAGIPMVQYHRSIESSNNFNNSSIHLDEQSDNRFGVNNQAISRKIVRIRIIIVILKIEEKKEEIEIIIEISLVVKDIEIKIIEIIESKDLKNQDMKKEIMIIIIKTIGE